LKHLFSQVEGDLDLQKILKSVPFPKRWQQRKRRLLLQWKRKMWKVGRLEKIRWMVKFYIRLHYEEKWSLNLPKMQRNKVKSNLLKLYFLIKTLIFALFS
jgi:hypothetical protein